MFIKKSYIYIIFLFFLFSNAGCVSFVSPGKRGLMWRPWSSGLDRKLIYEDGSVWHMPWNDVIDYDIRWKNYSEKVSILTADDLNIRVTVSVVARPSLNELPQLALEIGEEYYKQIIKPEFYTITHSVIAKYLHNDLPEKSPFIEKEILAGLRIRLKGKHLDFDNVTIDHIDYSRLVTQAVDRKLATKQALEQKEFETGIAKKDAEIQRISARGQRDSQKIINEGITKKYLQFKALEVQDKMAESANTKFYFIPMGKGGLPVIIDSK